MYISNPITPADIGAVPTSRQVIAGVNMTGGGALSGDVTLNASGGGGSGSLSLIERLDADGTVSTLLFDAIPNTFSQLLIIGNARSELNATLDALLIQFNGDTGANYEMYRMQANNATASGVFSGALTSVSTSIPALTATANISSGIEILVPDYVGLFNKNCSIRNELKTAAGGTGHTIYDRAGYWFNNAVIDEILLTCNGGNFTNGSNFSLYGLE
jgi:hypothetical protein